MTTNSPPLTDDLLRQALAELTAGPDSDLLLADVLRIVDSQTQVRRRAWDTRGWGRAAMLIAAAALLLAAAIGATVTLSRPQPSPLPTRTPLPLSTELIRVPDFFAPFAYRIPVGMSGNLEVRSAPDGFYSIAGDAANSGTLALFYMTGGMHGCPVDGDDPTTNDDVAALLRELDEGPISRTSLGGLPAWTVGVDPARGKCRGATFHLHGLDVAPLEAQLTLSKPGRLIAASSGAGTIGVLISAPNEAALSEWLPMADALVSGFEFNAPALSDRVLSVTDFVVPFTYRLPVGIAAQLEPYGSLEKLYVIDARAGGSGNLTLFPVSGIVHACGTSSGNGLPTPTVADDPAAFLEALRDHFGAGIGPTRPSVLGNLPAVGADVDPKLGTCVSVALHLDGLGLGFGQYEPRLNSPGRLIVARTQGRTVGVLISAPSAEALTEWLPIGQALVDGMVFQ